MPGVEPKAETIRSYAPGAVRAEPGVTRSVRANFIWTLSSSIVYALCQSGVFVVLARIGDTTMLGQYALALACVVPVFAFTDLQLRILQVTDSQNEYNFRDYLGLRITTNTVGMAIVGVLALISAPDKGTTTLLVVMGLGQAVESIRNVFHGQLQQRERMDIVGWSKIVSGPLILLAIGGGLILTGGILWAAVARVAVRVAMLLAWEMPLVAVSLSRPLRHVAKPRFHLATTKRLVWLAFPVAAVTGMVALQQNLPRLLVAHFLDASSVGKIAAMAYLLQPLRMVNQAVRQATIPRLSRLFAEDKRKHVRKLVIRIAVIGAAIGALGLLVSAVAGRLILSFTLGPQFTGLTTLFVLLTVPVCLRSLLMPWVVSLYATRRYRPLVIVRLVSLIVTACAGCWLIPQYGLRGAAYAGILGVLADAAVHAWNSIHRFWRKRTADRLTTQTAETAVIESLRRAG